MSGPTPTTIPSESLPLLARAALYRLVSLVFADPVSSRPAARRDLDLAGEAAGLLQDDAVVRAVADLAGSLPDEASDLRDWHTRIFGLLVTPDAPPYEVEYSEKTDLFWRTQQLADIAGFYNAFKLDLAHRDRPDHVAVEAEFLWYLLERLAGAIGRGHDARKRSLLEKAFRSFFAEHFGSWAASFAADLEELSRRRGVRYYEAAARLLREVERAERSHLALADQPPRRKHPLPVPPAPPCEECPVSSTSP